MMQSIHTHNNIQYWKLLGERRGGGAVIGYCSVGVGGKQGYLLDIVVVVYRGEQEQLSDIVVLVQGEIGIFIGYCSVGVQGDSNIY